VTDRYKFEYGDGTVYANVVDLVSRFRVVDAEVVIDIGCGFGAIAEPLQSMGLTYIGFDSDPNAIRDLNDRSIEAEILDFADADHAVRILDKRIGDRSLAAIVMIDSLEHLANGEIVLAALQPVAAARGCAPLTIAVPNITHVDLVGKLLLGRWDMTPTGILDDTHVAYFSEGHLNRVLRRAGWAQLSGRDYELVESDQHFPRQAAPIARAAPLRELLNAVREQAGAGSVVNEFVRVYAPVATPTSEPVAERSEAPLLSVLVRTQNRRPATLEETLLSLAAQTCEDFEVLVLPHDVPSEDMHQILYLVNVFPPEFKERVRVIPVEGGGRSRPLNVGLRAARGDYVAILDDDDVVFAHWAERFKSAAARHPGRVLRAVAAEQEIEGATWGGDRSGYEVVDRPRRRWSTQFDVADHLFLNMSPPCGWAFPRSAYLDLGIEFDESLPVLEDWDVLMQVVQLNGVSNIEEITALWRRWRNGESSTSVHSEQEWTQARTAVLSKLDARPLLLPRRSATKLHTLGLEHATLGQEVRLKSEQVDRLSNEVGELRAERDHYARLYEDSERDRIGIHDNLLDAHDRLEKIWTSWSWRVTKPLRYVRRRAQLGARRQG